MTYAIKSVCIQCRTALVQESSSDPAKVRSGGRMRLQHELTHAGKFYLYLVNVIKKSMPFSILILVCKNKWPEHYFLLS